MIHKYSGEKTEVICESSLYSIGLVHCLPLFYAFRLLVSSMVVWFVIGLLATIIVTSPLVNNY